MSLATPDAAAEFQAAYSELKQLAARMNALRRDLVAGDPRPLPDYALLDHNGPVRLSELFGDRDDLIVIHNMGRGCPYCTMWADGLNGLLPHLEDRAAVVLSSPDAPDVQRAFAAGRGWRFRMISTAGSTFTADMGYQEPGGDYWPGVSTFRKQSDGSVVRVARDYFGPGDAYCGAWPLFDLLDGGAQGWEPKFAY
jgi:predicted dithiol-disulfide oxidoreductase (DUF899 family)